MIINGDGTDIKYLEDAGTEKADVFVAVTGDDKTNLISCQIAKKNFSVGRTVARVNEPKNESVFNELGIDIAISTVTAASIVIKNAVTSGELMTLLTLEGGGMEMVELRIHEDSSAANKAIEELRLPDDCVLTAIIRGGHVIFPKGKTVIKVGDLVMVLTTTERIDKLERVFVGERA